MNQELIDKKQEYYSYSRPEMLEYIPKDAKKILEVGCGKGYFGRAIKESFQDIEVHGIELCKEAAEEAKQKLDYVMNLKIEEAIPGLQNESYGCIVFNDVLEHLPYPEEVLKSLKQKLAPNGIIVASIPNVRYFDVVYDLVVNKNWKYQSEGILDYTHLRFFTEKSIPVLFESAGYELIKMKGLNKNRFGILFKVLNFLSGHKMNDMKFLQFACIAKLKDKQNA